MQLQECWYSYVNTCLILFVTESTKSFVFGKKSFAVQLQGNSAQRANAVALCILLRAEYYSFHPSHADSSLLWGKHFPKGLIHEKKAFCNNIQSCKQLHVLLLPQKAILNSLRAAFCV